MRKQIVFLTGLPRSGSTLLANVLGMHPEITASPTSPLCNLVETLRRSWSQDEMLLAELEYERERVYARLVRSTRAFVEAWCSDAATPWTVDKSRAWLQQIELLEELYPNFKMVICLRDLRDVYASIERQHKKTRMLTLPGAHEISDVDGRAQQYFAPNGIIGGPLRALYNLGDLGDLSEHLFFWHFERFLDDPDRLTEQLLTWLGVEPTSLDLSTIEPSTREADAFYRLKYPHRVRPTIDRPAGFTEAGVSPRILAAIVQRFAWFYRAFYGKGGVQLDREDSTHALQTHMPTFG